MPPAPPPLPYLRRTAPPPPQNLLGTTDELQLVAELSLDLAKTYGPEQMLVVLDIDNTLLAMEQDLGSDQWYYWQEDLEAENPCSPLLVGRPPGSPGRAVLRERHAADAAGRRGAGRADAGSRAQGHRADSARTGLPARDLPRTAPQRLQFLAKRLAAATRISRSLHPGRRFTPRRVRGRRDLRRRPGQGPDAEVGPRPVRAALPGPDRDGGRQASQPEPGDVGLLLVRHQGPRLALHARGRHRRGLRPRQGGHAVERTQAAAGAASRNCWGRTTSRCPRKPCARPARRRTDRRREPTLSRSAAADPLRGLPGCVRRAMDGFQHDSRLHPPR